MSEKSPGLTIDLAALVANWRTLAEFCAPAQASAVVKADAYGLGVRPVARALYRAGCRHFFVATLDEAFELVPCLGEGASCYLLGGVPAGCERECAQARIIPILSSMPAVRRWQAALRGARADAAPCGLKFDTGMSRQGLSLAELDQLLREKTLLVQLAPCVILSHLACADEPSHPQNPRQLAAFRRREPALRQLLPQCRLSLANSCGIYLGRDYHFDLVRPGAALYGYQPPASPADAIKTVVSLALTTLQIKRLDAESAIGYGAVARRPENTILAVCAGGYADGIHNILQGQGYGELLGVRVPVVGRISMDCTIFDVSAVPAIDAWLDGDRPLPPVELLNERLTFTGLSRERGLLGYELLTGLRCARFKRIYRGGE